MQQYEFSVHEHVASQPEHMKFLVFFTRISSTAGSPFSSPFSYSLWSSSALISTMVCLAISLTWVTMLVMRNGFASGLCSCGLPFVFHSGFPPPCAQVITSISGEFVLVCLRKHLIGFFCWFLTPVPTVIHPFLSPRELWVLFMRERTGKSQLSGQGQALMKHRDQVVAALASFTGHWAIMRTQGHLSEKSSGKDCIKGLAVLKAPSAIAVLQNQSQLCN